MRIDYHPAIKRMRWAGAAPVDRRYLERCVTISLNVTFVTGMWWSGLQKREREREGEREREEEGGRETGCWGRIRFSVRPVGHVTSAPPQKAPTPGVRGFQTAHIAFGSVCQKVGVTPDA